MTPETISRVVEELGHAYPGAVEAREGDITFVRLPEVFFPGGCSPASCVGLVVLDPRQPAPKLLLKTIPSLPNGRTPTSISAETAGGEGWHGFSFNQPWNEGVHTALQFVEGRLRRFALEK